LKLKDNSYSASTLVVKVATFSKPQNAKYYRNQTLGGFLLLFFGKVRANGLFELRYIWPFMQNYYFKRKFKKDGSITLSTENG